MSNYSTRESLLQDLVEKLVYAGFVRYSGNGKELARGKNVSTKDPGRLSRDFNDTSIYSSGLVKLWNEGGRLVSITDYTRRLLEVAQQVDDYLREEIEKLLNELQNFNNGSGARLRGSPAEKIKRVWSQVKGYEIPDDVAEKFEELGVLVVEQYEDKDYVVQELERAGLRDVAEKFRSAFERAGRMCIVAPLIRKGEYTGVQVRWLEVEGRPKFQNIRRESHDFVAGYGAGKSKKIFLVEGVLDALMVHARYGDEVLAVPKEGFWKVLNSILYDEDGNLRADIEDFRLIVAYDKDEAGRHYSLRVVRDYGFVEVHEALWDGEEDIDQVLAEGRPVNFKRADKLYLEVFREEIDSVSKEVRCVRAFSENAVSVESISEEEWKVLIRLFPYSKALRNLGAIAGFKKPEKLNVTYCQSSLLSAFCPLQKCLSGKGLIVGKLSVEALDEVNGELKIVKYTNEKGSIEKDEVYAEVKKIDRDLAGAVGLARVKEPVKSIALEVLSEQVREIKKGVREVSEDWELERLRDLLERTLERTVNEVDVNEFMIQVSYSEFSKCLKEAGARRGDMQKLKGRKLIKHTTILDEDGKVVHVVQISKEFLHGSTKLLRKIFGSRSSVKEKLMAKTVLVITRDMAMRGVHNNFVENHFEEMYEILGSGKGLLLTEGPQFQAVESEKIEKVCKEMRDKKKAFVLLKLVNGDVITMDENRLEEFEDVDDEDTDTGISELIPF